MPKTKTGVGPGGRRFWSATPAKPKRLKAKIAKVRAMSADDLCISLSGIAAFHVEDKEAQSKIYEAIRRLQLLERAAVEAGLLPEAR